MKQTSDNSIVKNLNLDKLKPHSKLWISDSSGNITFGSGRYCILREIEKHGSMNKAAAEMGMSFRTLWGKIRETEKHIGYKLVENRKNHRSSGSVLTAEAKDILKRFEKYKEKAIREIDRIFAETFYD